MKSAVWYGKHDLRVEQRPVPEPGPGEVLIQVKACGVCGTDVHIYEGGKGAAAVTPPTILGHEFSGVVVKAGAAVRSCQPGDRVCIDPNCYCGTCAACRSGLAHFCTQMAGYGTTVDGGFAEYCAVDARQVYRLGAHTSFAQGAMAEPAACCLHGIDLCGIRPGHQVVVIGGGMIGLLMVQLARLAGAARVALVEPVAAKRETGRKLGVDVCIDPQQQDPAAALRQGGLTWVNTVIECVGRPETIAQAIDLAGSKAVVMMFGLTKPDETVPLKPFTVFEKELELKASYINPYTQARALELIDTGRLDVTSMVCPPCSLEALPGILARPDLRAKGKYIIDPSL